MQIRFGHVTDVKITMFAPRSTRQRAMARRTVRKGKHINRVGCRGADNASGEPSRATVTEQTTLSTFSLYIIKLILHCSVYIIIYNKYKMEYYLLDIEMSATEE